MEDRRETHLVTRGGLLCGARPIERGSPDESRVTCVACRSAMEARHREHLASIRQAVSALARILKDCNCR